MKERRKANSWMCFYINFIAESIMMDMLPYGHATIMVVRTYSVSHHPLVPLENAC